jgi:hypothetical protein
MAVLNPGAQSSLGGFNNPHGMWIDAGGNMYVADSGSQRVLRIPHGQTVASATTVGTGLINPIDVVVDGTGSVFIVDAGTGNDDGRVIRVPNENGTLNSTDQVVVLSNQTSTLPGVNYGQPRAILVTSFGYLFVGYPQQVVVVRFDDGALNIADQFVAAGGFTNIAGIALDTTGAGNLYVADAGNVAAGNNGQVVKVPTVNGSYNPGAQTVIGSGFNTPTGVSADAAGNAYVVDSGNTRVVMVPIENGAYNVADQMTVGNGLVAPVRVWASVGSKVYIADGGTNQIVTVDRSQANFTFARQQIGTASPAQTATMWSIGNQTLTFQQPPWQASGNSNSFNGIGTATNGCDMTGATPLTAGYGCGIVVTFQPTTAGPLSASETLLSNAVDAPVAQLSGTGIAMNASTINLNLSQNGSNPIPYGTNLSLTMSVNPVGSVVPTGAFTYQIDGGAAQTVALVSGACTLQLGSGLSVGFHVVSVTYSGDTNYLPQSNPQIQPITVSTVTPTITWATPAAINYGTALSGTQLNATASVPGTFVYTPAAGTVLAAGAQTLSVTFAPSDTLDYTTVIKTASLTVSMVTPTITWATPAAINYGTALSGTQLNATANVAGSFVYTPAAGTIVQAGTDTLLVTFTPTDTTDYTTATASVTITVNVNGNLNISSGHTYTFVNGTITGNVVMTGGTLVLNNTVVGGNLQMSGGSLLLTNNSTIQGNLQITGGTYSLDPSRIRGNLQVQNIPAGAAQNQICGMTVNSNVIFQNNGTAVLIGSPSCPGNSISGNLQVTSNSAATEVYGNSVSGNLQVTSNSAATQVDINTVNGNLQIQNNSASAAVFSNTAKGNLQCSGNNSSLISGGGNKAAQKQGQCASF